MLPLLSVVNPDPQEGRDFLNFKPPPFQEIKKSVIQYCPRGLQ